MGRTSEQTLHSFPQPFKQPGVTMETPLCVFPNYPNPLHILSHTHRDTHKNTRKDTNTHTFWTDNPLPPSMHTNTVNSHQVTQFFPPVLSIIFDTEGVRTDTHSGHQKFLDLVDGPLELDLGPVVCVLHCDQDMEVLAEVLPVGLPSVHLLLKHKKSPFLNAPHKLSSLLQTGKRVSLFLLVWLSFLDQPQTTHKHTHTPERFKVGQSRLRGGIRRL